MSYDSQCGVARSLLETNTYKFRELFLKNFSSPVVEFATIVLKTIIVLYLANEWKEEVC